MSGGVGKVDSRGEDSGVDAGDDSPERGSHSCREPMEPRDLLIALRGRPVTSAWGLNVDEPTDPARSLQEPPASRVASSHEARASDFSSLFLKSLFSFRRN